MSSRDEKCYDKDLVDLPTVIGEWRMSFKTMSGLAAKELAGLGRVEAECRVKETERKTPGH